MLITTRGIVLRTVKFSETSIITKIYTESSGLQSYMVNGVRKPGSGNRSPLFQPFNILDLVIYKRENKNLQRIKEVKLGHIFRTIPFDVIKSSMALFLVEILNKAIGEEEKNEQLFRYIEQSVLHLDASSERESNFHLQFLLGLTKYLGFYPAGNFSAANPFFDLKEGKFIVEEPEHPYFLSSSESRRFGEMLAGEPSLICASDRANLLEKILQFYEFHLSGFHKIKSHAVLHEVFRD